MREAPGLAAVVGLNHHAFQTARGAVLEVAKRDAEKRRQNKVSEALVLVGCERTLPLRDERLLLLTPTFAAIVGGPDSTEFADHEAVIGVDKFCAVENRFLVRQRVVGEFRR